VNNTIIENGFADDDEEYKDSKNIYLSLLNLSIHRYKI